MEPLYTKDSVTPVTEDEKGWACSSPPSKYLPKHLHRDGIHPMINSLVLVMVAN